MTSAFINSIATAVPDFEIHSKFIDYCPRLLDDQKFAPLFLKLARRSHIDHRYSFFEPHPDTEKMDRAGFYETNNFPDTKQRMEFYEKHAFLLVQRALDKLDISNTSHLIVTSCTGFYAPGIDLQVIQHYQLSPTVQRTMVGFMGCYAAINALKLARYIIAAEPDAKVLIINIELCTLHLKPSGSLEELLPFLIFSDGCAASILSSEASGIELHGFNSTFIPDTENQITWRIGEQGFDMNLSVKVPANIGTHLPPLLDQILAGWQRKDIAHWAIHPGGKAILDAVRDALLIDEQYLLHSREILRQFGNMSSATIMFVLQKMLSEKKLSEKKQQTLVQLQEKGIAIAFGPGMSIETMRFAM